MKKPTKNSKRNPKVVEATLSHVRGGASKSIRIRAKLDGNVTEAQ